VYLLLKKKGKANFFFDGGLTALLRLKSSEFFFIRISNQTFGDKV